jgi:acetyltransferase-like isoleucine patch superfamily enzyme
MEGAVVGAGARVVCSVVGPGAQVADGVRLDRVTVGDRARVGADAVVEPGSRVDCDAVL